MDSDYEDCYCCCEKESRPCIFEDSNENFWKGYFFGVMYGMVLSAVILIR